MSRLLVMTPEGFPVSGFNTFSVYEEDGDIFAQVQGLERATDPIWFGYALWAARRSRTVRGHTCSKGWPPAMESTPMWSTPKPV